MLMPWSKERARRAAQTRLGMQAWPPALLDALARLRDAGGRALLVGGSVRDALLGRPADRRPDIATDLLPEAVRGCFERVEPVGEQHGTLLVLHGGLEIECTTFRREGEYADSRRPIEVWFTRDPLEDLARRDLTVNALAFDPVSGELLDPFGGARDLQRRVLRAVGEPEARFREDALRPLRAARLAATLEMQLEEATRAAFASVRDRMGALAIERVREELVKLMTAPRPSEGFEILREAGMLELWLPELQRCRGVPQNRFHAYDVYFHSLHSCDAVPPDRPIVRWAALLHDIGKPGTRVERNGEGTFHQHEFLGAELTDAALRRLRFPNDERERIVHLVREHMFDYQPRWSDAAVRRWLRRVGPENVADLFDLRVADTMGNGLRTGTPAQLDALSTRVRRVLAEGDALGVEHLAVNGEDVMRVLGRPAGPDVGNALRALLERVLDEPSLNTREALLGLLESMRDGAARP